MRTRRGRWCALLLLAASLVAAGCARRPGADAAALRSHYRATLLGFAVLPPAPSDHPPVNEQTDAPAAARPAAAAAEESGLVDAPVATRDVELRIQVQHDSPVALAALTVEVQLLGPEGDDVERQHYRVLLDTSSIAAGPGSEVRSLLREVPYEPGERFHVFVRPEVPARERALYAEYLSSR